jgi:hydrogenase maturation protease
MKILAMALGTALHGDDGVGLALADGLDELVPGLEVLEVSQLAPDHADAVAEFDGVIFLDASVAGEPGEVQAAFIEPRTARAAVIHALTPEEILGLVRAQYGRAPPAAVVTVSGRDFAFGDPLSPEVEAALPLARERARAMAATFAR